MSELFDELIAELESSDRPDRRLAAELLAMRAELARLQAIEAAARELLGAEGDIGAFGRRLHKLAAALERKP